MIADALQPQTFEEGEVIITEGDSDFDSMNFYLVEKGTAVATYEGNEIGVMNVGDYFGEKALIERKPRFARRSLILLMSVVLRRCTYGSSATVESEELASNSAARRFMSSGRAPKGCCPRGAPSSASGKPSVKPHRVRTPLPRKTRTAAPSPM